MQAMELLDGQEYLTTKEVAEAKKCARATVSIAFNAGRLKGRKVGNSVLIEKISADAWTPKRGGWERARPKRWTKKNGDTL